MRNAWIGDTLKQLQQFSGEAILIGGPRKDWMDQKIILSRVVALGYPRIPQSTAPVLVAVSTEINATVDTFDGAPYGRCRGGAARLSFSPTPPAGDCQPSPR